MVEIVPLYCFSLIVLYGDTCEKAIRQRELLTWFDEWNRSGFKYGKGDRYLKHGGPCQSRPLAPLSHVRSILIALEGFNWSGTEEKGTVSVFAMQSTGNFSCLSKESIYVKLVISSLEFFDYPVELGPNFGYYCKKLFYLMPFSILFCSMNGVRAVRSI
ncbi:hypothetical protein GWI33_018222 [Rhynchophorus ferrugineus]|uniref:Uncharacterized protein n=1 Tax=Rhynchophorus ferrugineus TaxID=354439 RepID=A0A834HTV0_RHYFE|nr:hypothetical protein GWI33_018222 [Rhynchophorus ferrugineus]